MDKLVSTDPYMRMSVTENGAFREPARAPIQLLQSIQDPGQTSLTRILCTIAHVAKHLCSCRRLYINFLLLLPY